MSCRCFATLVLSLALCVTWTDAVQAQSPSKERDSEGARAADDTESDPSDKDEPEDMPDAPDERLEQAESAFDNAEYDELRPLLEPTLEPKSAYEDSEREQQARTLFAIGYYFDAQQVTDAEQRNELHEEAEAQFLELLRSDPDYDLSPLIYPASVVELFDSVREEHREELDEIRRQTRREGDGDDEELREGLSTVYIERVVERRSVAVNLMPFGVGQFYNDQPWQGSAFAAAQTLALAVNVVSYWRIESLRGPDGYYDPGPENSADVARQWRTGQYAGLGLFAGLYAWSVVAALLDHQQGEVDVRTLDEPPPELSGSKSNSGASLHIGLGGLGLTW